MLPFSVKLVKVNPEFGVAVTVTEDPAAYEPVPVVVPPVGGLDDKNTENCCVGIGVKFATKVLLLVKTN